MINFFKYPMSINSDVIIQFLYKYPTRQIYNEKFICKNTTLVSGLLRDSKRQKVLKCLQLISSQSLILDLCRCIF